MIFILFYLNKDTHIINMSGFANKLQQKNKKKKEKDLSEKKESRQEKRERNIKDKQDQLRADQSKEKFENEELERRKFLLSALETTPPSSFLNQPITLKNGFKNPLYLESGTQEYRNRKLFTDLLTTLIESRQFIPYLSSILSNTNFSFVSKKDDFSKETRKKVLKNLENASIEYIILNILEFMKDHQKVEEEDLFGDIDDENDENKENIYSSELTREYGSLDHLIEEQTGYLNHILKKSSTEKENEYADFILSRLTKQERPSSYRGDEPFVLQKFFDDEPIQIWEDNKKIPSSITFYPLKSYPLLKQKFEYAKQPQTVSLENDKPWISNYEATYVYSQDLPDKYYVKNNSITLESKTFYKVSSLFDKLLSASTITIDDKNVTIHSNEGVYHVMILYKRRYNKNIFLDNEIYRRQQMWMRRQYLDSIELSSEILDASLSSIPMIKSYIETSLSSHGFDPKLSSQILSSSENVKDILELLSKFTLFGKNGMMENIASGFNKRLKNDYYYYPNLIELPVKEILQEYYFHPDNQSRLNNMDALVEKYTNLETSYHAVKLWSLVNNIDLPEQKYTIKDFEKFSRLQQTNCSNPYDGTPNNIIYYLSMNKNNVYCFKIEDLLNQFKQGNFTNSYDSKDFSQKFVDMILNYYKFPNTSTNVVVPEIEEKEEEEEENVIINAFLDMETKLLKSRQKIKSEYIDMFYDGDKKRTFKTVLRQLNAPKNDDINDINEDIL